MNTGQAAAAGRIAAALIELSASEDEASLALLNLADMAMQKAGRLVGHDAGTHVAATVARLIASQAARRAAALDQLAEAIGATCGIHSP